MIKLNKRCVGVTVGDERSEYLLSNDDSEDGDVHLHERTEESNASIDIIRRNDSRQEPVCVDKHCSTIKVDGKSYYKVSLVKEYSIVIAVKSFQLIG